MLNAVQREFILESWLEYGIGMSFFILRFYARWKVMGLHSFSWDDFFAALSMVFYTFDPALLQVVSECPSLRCLCYAGASLTVIVTHGSFVGLDEESAQQLPPPVVESYTTGSKALFAAWFTYVTLIWTLKGQVLGYYNRLTAGTWQQKWVKIMAIASAVSWVALILLIFLRCTPIQKNWQIVPYAGDQCTRTNSTVVLLMVLNILNDIGLVMIPASVLWEAKIPIKRKLMIAALLSSSFFIITCALLRGILGLQSINNIVVSIQWGTRETFVTIIVICIPTIKPLFSKGGSKGGSYYSSTGHRLGSKDKNGRSIQLRSTINDPERMGSMKEADEQSLGSSRDLIEDRTGVKGFSKGEINITTEYSVEDHSRADLATSDGQSNWSYVNARPGENVRHF